MGNRAVPPPNVRGKLISVQLGRIPAEKDGSFWKCWARDGRAAHGACSSKTSNDDDDEHKEGEK